MELIEKMTAKAKANIQRIVLPEGTEPRTLSAADRIIAEKSPTSPLLVIPPTYTPLQRAETRAHRDANIVNPGRRESHRPLCAALFELRKNKGITMEEARLTTANPLYLGCLMVKAGDADGQVAGAQEHHRQRTPRRIPGDQDTTRHQRRFGSLPHAAPRRT